MGASWLRGLGTVAVFGVAGCSTSSAPNLRTPIPEQYSLPPEDDSRFSLPVAYPKETLNQDTVKTTNPSKLPSQQPQIAPMGGPGGRGAPGGF